MLLSDMWAAIQPPQLPAVITAGNAADFWAQYQAGVGGTSAIDPAFYAELVAQIAAIPEVAYAGNNFGYGGPAGAARAMLEQQGVIDPAAAPKYLGQAVGRVSGASSDEGGNITGGSISAWFADASGILGRLANPFSVATYRANAASIIQELRPQADGGLLAQFAPALAIAGIALGVGALSGALGAGASVEAAATAEVTTEVATTTAVDLSAPTLITSDTATIGVSAMDPSTWDWSSLGTGGSGSYDAAGNYIPNISGAGGLAPSTLDTVNFWGSSASDVGGAASAPSALDNIMGNVASTIKSVAGAIGAVSGAVQRTAAQGRIGTTNAGLSLGGLNMGTLLLIGGAVLLMKKG